MIDCQGHQLEQELFVRQTVMSLRACTHCWQLDIQGVLIEERNYFGESVGDSPVAARRLSDQDEVVLLENH